MSTAVFVFASLLGGAAVASPFAYIAGRRSSREELANAEQAVVTANASAARDDLAEVKVRPERTGEQPAVEMYRQTDEETLGPVAQAILAGDGIGPVARRFLPDESTWSGASHLQADPADDTGTGTVAYMSGEWEPAAPAPKRVGARAVSEGGDRGR